MKSLVKNEPKSFSRRGRIIIYLSALLVIAFLLMIDFYQKGMDESTIRKGIKIRVPIIEIGCSDGRGKSRLYFRNNKNAIKHVNVSFTECSHYAVGDTISIYANDESDWYEIDPL